MLGRTCVTGTRSHSTWGLISDRYIVIEDPGPDGPPLITDTGEDIWAALINDWDVDVGRPDFSEVYSIDLRRDDDCADWAVFCELGSFLIRDTPIPEPPVLLLFGTGLLGLIGVKWRRKVA
jgi:hypothetical protein